MQLRDDIVLICNTSFFPPPSSSEILSDESFKNSRILYNVNNIRINPITSNLCNYLYRIAKSYDITSIPLFPKIRGITNEIRRERQNKICKLRSSSLIEPLLFPSPLPRDRPVLVPQAAPALAPGRRRGCLILFSRPRRARLLSQFNANEPVSSNYSN